MVMLICKNMLVLAPARTHTHVVVEAGQAAATAAADLGASQAGFTDPVLAGLAPVPACFRSRMQ